LLAGVLQMLIEVEATQKIGAERFERTEGRTTQCNGSRPKTVSTTSGDLTVGIPKLRSGSFFPSLLEPRRWVDVALHAVISEAYVHGVSTRKVDDLMQGHRQRAVQVRGEGLRTAGRRGLATCPAARPRARRSA